MILVDTSVVLVWWDAVGDNLSALRAAGVAVPFADAILATVALESNLEFWTRDQQFRHGVLRHYEALLTASDG